MRYRKETVKSPNGEGTRYYIVQGETVGLSEIAERIESRRGVSKIDTMRVIWNFLDEIAPMLMKGDRIDIEDYCTLSATITKGKDGKPKVGGIQLNATGSLRKAMSNAELKECLNTAKTDR